MITLYITRHGETVWNTETRMQGRLDSEITELGKRNTLSLGKRLIDTEFAAIFSSPSGRTKQTTNLLHIAKDIPIFYDDNLREMNLGDWEGKTQATIKETYPEEYELFWKKPHLFTPLGGETFEETKTRVMKVLERIKKEFPTGNIMIVTHAVVIKCLFSIFKDTSIENLWDPPFIHGTSLTIVEVNGDDYRFILEGDLSHQEN